MPHRDIKDLILTELISCLADWGEQPFRAKQIFDWIYQKGAGDFAAMANIPASLQEKLRAEFSFFHANLRDKQVSRDGTRKYLFELRDNALIEAVWIPSFGKRGRSDRATLCVSTQVGCKFGCAFCASGANGFKRHLSCAEILDEVLSAKADAGQQAPLTHVVFMGVGEPLDNYDNVLKAIRLLNDPAGLRLAARRITISTCGLIPEMERLAKEHLQVELSVSLHAAIDTLRQKIMPVAKRYPLKALIAACRRYTKETRRQITFEYMLMKGVNDAPQDARELAKLLKGLLCQVNLIAFNPTEQGGFQAPNPQGVEDFQGLLLLKGLAVTVRVSRGGDIAAACGQLRLRSSSCAC